MNRCTNENAYEFYEESRKYPRIKISLPIKLYINDEPHLNASIYDISPDGLQVRCSREVALAINPGGKNIKAEDNLLIKTEFELPIANEKKTISVESKVYYFTIISGDDVEDVALGLKFKTFSGKSITYIGQHILSELEPIVV